MPTIAVIGGQWGDEGKGKIVDLLAEKVKVVARYNGGNNAGHTVVNPIGTFRMHHIPSGIFYPDVTCIIGNGTVIDPKVLLGEIDNLKEHNLSVSKLFISDRAHIIMPYHILLDSLEEGTRGKNAIGTTKRGIGPAYADKVARLGIRAGDLINKEFFLYRLQTVLEYKNTLLTKVYGHSPLSAEEIYEEYSVYEEQLSPFIREANTIIEEALDREEIVLLEGAQGILLDIDFGTYPYVTSSSSVAGGACSGLGISPARINRIAGVFKAYVTRVGGGPMPTELLDEDGKTLRERGHEYGTTTGRPRRCGWFDAALARYSVQISGITAVALTKFDILDSFPKIKICTAYEIDDDQYIRPPAIASLLEKCEPVYEELPGWQSPTTEIRHFDDLPEEARTYVRRLEELVGCPVAIISVGPGREQSIIVNPLL